MCGWRRTSFAAIAFSESATVKCPASAADLGEEHPFEDQVADLAAQRVGVAAVDRVEHLVRLLEHEAAQRLERLLAIPRAALRPAQPRHDVDESLEGGAGVGGHEAGMLASRGGEPGRVAASVSPIFILLAGDDGRGALRRHRRSRPPASASSRTSSAPAS